MGVGKGGEGLVNPVQAKVRAAKKGGLGFAGDERTDQQIKDEKEKGVKVDEEKVCVWACLCVCVYGCCGSGGLWGASA